MLTGDKEETAVNVSFLAGHFAPGLETLRVTKQTALGGCADTLEAKTSILDKRRSEDVNYRFGLVIDGQSLNFALRVRPFRTLTTTKLLSYRNFVIICRKHCVTDS